MQDEFISGTSAAYLESLEDQWREDPNSVPASWASLLRQMGEWTRLVYPSTGDSRARTRAVRAARAQALHRARDAGRRLGEGAVAQREGARVSGEFVRCEISFADAKA